MKNILIAIVLCTIGATVQANDFDNGDHKYHGVVYHRFSNVKEVGVFDTLKECQSTNLVLDRYSDYVCHYNQYTHLEFNSDFYEKDYDGAK